MATAKTKPTRTSGRSARPQSDTFDRIVPHIFESRLLKQRRNVLIYLPPRYKAGRKRYPILYLLHGMTGSEIDWVFKAKVHITLDAMIDSGKIAPLLVAIPNDGLAHSGTFYTDWYDGTGKFESYFLREVMREVNGVVRARPGRSATAIAGLSMGGYGALALALRHPRTFCAAASLSGLTTPSGVVSGGKWAKQVFGPKRGKDARYRQLRDPRHLVTLPSTRSVGLHLNCGRSDFLLQSNRKFHRLLERLGRPHEYMEFPGGHNWPYWTKHIAEVLLFIDRQFGMGQ